MVNLIRTVSILSTVLVAPGINRLGLGMGLGHDIVGGPEFPVGDGLDGSRRGNLQGTGGIQRAVGMDEGIHAASIGLNILQQRYSGARSGLGLRSR